MKELYIIGKQKKRPKEYQNIKKQRLAFSIDRRTKIRNVSLAPKIPSESAPKRGTAASVVYS